MAAKRPSIASLIRNAGKSEAEFIGAWDIVLKENDTERLIEFIGRINQPLKFEASDEEVMPIEDLEFETINWETEASIDAVLVKFHARHMRKLKWYITHPDIDSIGPGLRIFNCMGYITQHRLYRILAILDQTEVLSPSEWGLARELLNRSYREFREASALATGRWFESNLENLDPEEVRDQMSSLPTTIEKIADKVSALRDRVEERRAQMAVQPPEPYPTVRPPRYFGGDLMEDASWTHYWKEVGGLAQTLRHHVEM